LEKLVQAEAKTPELSLAINHHLLDKRAKFGVRTDFLHKFNDLWKKAGLFEAVKAVTIDGSMKHFHQMRLNRTGKLIPLDVVKRQFGLSLNIMEATFTDLASGGWANMVVGLKLALNPAKDLRFTEDGLGLEYVVSKNWAALYETWNLAFITGNLKNLHILYPKLLIPAVLGAEPNAYVFHRALALSLSIQFFLLRTLSGKPDLELPNHKELSDLWGKINVKLGSV